MMMTMTMIMMMIMMMMKMMIIRSSTATRRLPKPCSRLQNSTNRACRLPCTRRLSN